MCEEWIWQCQQLKLSNIRQLGIYLAVIDNVYDLFCHILRLNLNPNFKYHSKCGVFNICFLKYSDLPRTMSICLGSSGLL